MKQTESYASGWDAIADTPQQAANLRTRAELDALVNIATALGRRVHIELEAA